MTQLTQEEIRDSLLSLYEENEESMASYVSEIEKIEDEGIVTFERKVIAVKNRLINDESVSEENLQKKYLEEVEEIRKIVLQEVEEKIKEVTSKIIA